MRAKNIRWVGVSTKQYTAMSEFVEKVMGLEKAFEEPTTVEYRTEEGDALQLMAPGGRYFAFFTAHARGPVPCSRSPTCTWLASRLPE